MAQDRWDEEYDVVVVGTGAAGLTGAITAADNGLRTLVVEKEAVWGGTTGYSGGVLWIPDHFLMREAGVPDSEEAALEYLEATVGDAGPGSTRTRKVTYLRRSKELALFLRDRGFEWTYAPLYPDMYSDAPGARSGRALEPGLFDGTKLGEWQHTLIHPGRPPVAIKSGDEVRSLQIMRRTPRAAAHTLRMFGRTVAWLARRRAPLAAGQALLGKLMHILQSSYQVPVWLESPLRELVFDGDRVVGVVIERQGRMMRIGAGKAVLLGAGGFARDEEFRRRYQPVGSEWTSAAPGDTGDAIKLGLDAGAAVARMEDAWWCPAYRVDGTMFLSLFERSFPGCLIVDATGERYFNESASFIDFTQAMLARNGDGGSVPSWLIMDAKHRRRYMLGTLPGGLTPKRLVDDGTLVKASSIDDLATQCGIDAAQLSQTIERFNGFARVGIDQEFHRGETLLDRYYSDPTTRPNPTLAPIENAPFWAIRLYPGDASTNGGLVTDEHARVLREKDGEPIAGLYAAGNTTAGVTTPLYVGPGSTIGPAATFAYLAMKHAAAEGAANDA